MKAKDFREVEQGFIDDATAFFGKYKGKKILECNDPDYWTWVWKDSGMYKALGKSLKKAIRIAAQKQIK